MFSVFASLSLESFCELTAAATISLTCHQHCSSSTSPSQGSRDVHTTKKRSRNAICAGLHKRSNSNTKNCIKKDDWRSKPQRDHAYAQACGSDGDYLVTWFQFPQNMPPLSTPQYYSHVLLVAVKPVKHPAINQHLISGAFEIIISDR